MTADGGDFGAFAERFRKLALFSPADAEGQDTRAAGRFALLAMAGELATEYGVTGWPEGAAIEAAAVGFNAWRTDRGKGNDEHRQILERVSAFIERHGDGRFSNADATDDRQGTKERAGWWRADPSTGERIYLFTADGMGEALKGFDFKRALDALEAAKVLPPAGSDPTKSKAPWRNSSRGSPATHREGRARRSTALAPPISGTCAQ